jgi:O-antigen ligase
MAVARFALAAGVALASLIQLWRVPRLWAFLFLFIVLFPKLPLAVVPGNSTPIRVDDLILAVVLGGWLLAQLLGRRRPIPPSPVTPFLLLYGFVAAATSLLGYAAGTTTPLTAALHFFRRAEYAMIYYFFFRSIAPDALHDAVRVLRFAFVAVLTIWVVQHWTLGPPTSGAIMDWQTLWTSYTPTFSASYDFGGYLMLTTVILYALWSTGADRSVFTTATLLAAIYLLFNADSRGSLLGLAVAIVLDLFLRLRWQVALALVTTGWLAPYLVNSRKMERMLTIGAAFLDSFSFATAQQAFLSDPSIGMRLRNWNIALERWSTNPLVGEGLGSYLRYTEQYDDTGTPDGWYIRLLAESGLLGLLAFVMLAGGLLWMLLSTYGQEKRPLPRAIVYGAALGVIAMLVNALLIDTFVSYKIMGAFWMIVGVGTRVVAEGQPRAATDGGRPMMTKTPGFTPA